MTRLGKESGVLRSAWTGWKGYQSDSKVIVYAVLGAITEAVAGLFFAQSNQARRLMAQFFDKLRDDRRLEEAINLADRIADDRLAASLQAVLAMQLVESKVTPSVLPGFRDDVPPA